MYNSECERRMPGGASNTPGVALRRFPEMRSKLTLSSFSDTHIERFWRSVARRGDDDCWLWTAGIGTRGYGQFRVGQLMVGSHRVAFILSSGEIPEGLCVCHSCDTPLCCNPAHLFLGTHAMNAADRKAKGRSAYGDRSGSRLHPESRPHGLRNGAHTHPERRARGDRNGSRLHPERRASGERNGRYTKPESA